MANFKIIVSEPETRKSFQLEVEQDKVALIGKKIGDEFSGDVVGLVGYGLKITGGTDKDGFPMLPNVEGMVKRKVLLSGKPGFHPKIKGQRKRKTVRGNTVSDSIVQVNCKVVKKGEKALEELIPTKPNEAKPESETKPEGKKLEEQKTKPEEKAVGKEGGEGSQGS